MGTSLDASYISCVYLHTSRKALVSPTLVSLSNSTL